MNSFAHYSFGAVCEWMLNDLAGIQSDGPGYDKIIIHPHPPTPGSNPDRQPIDWVKAHYDSIHGGIASAWRRTETQFELTVEIPANTTATIYLPATAAEAITESGRSLNRAVGVKYLRSENNCRVFTVVAGKYHFVAKRKG